MNVSFSKAMRDCISFSSIEKLEFLKKENEMLESQLKKAIEKKEECVTNIAKEDISAYATKYKECRMCGESADCTYINQIDGLCNTCRSNEEYYEHEHRVSGD